MVEIVGRRLPKFTKEHTQMVKGSIDFLGVKQYISYYIYDPKKTQTKCNRLPDGLECRIFM